MAHAVSVRELQPYLVADTSALAWVVELVLTPWEFTMVSY